jgi:indole-3-glycerol phosphate synthase
VLITQRGASAPRGFRAALEAAKKRQKGRPYRRDQEGQSSQGVIRADFDPEKIARDYERGGRRLPLRIDRHAVVPGSARRSDGRAPGDASSRVAARISCSILSDRRSRARLARLHSRHHGDGGRRDSPKLLEAAREWGMDALVEVHDEDELTRALRFGAIYRHQQRDLKTFVTDIETRSGFNRWCPPDVTSLPKAVSRSPRILSKLASGHLSYLIGESLMRAEMSKAATHSLLSGVGYEQAFPSR